jgi:hypothetical protein
VAGEARSVTLAASQPGRLGNGRRAACLRLPTEYSPQWQHANRQMTRTAQKALVLIYIGLAWAMIGVCCVRVTYAFSQLCSLGVLFSLFLLARRTHLNHAALSTLSGQAAESRRDRRSLQRGLRVVARRQVDRLRAPDRRAGGLWRQGGGNRGYGWRRVPLHRIPLPGYRAQQVPEHKCRREGVRNEHRQEPRFPEGRERVPALRGRGPRTRSRATSRRSPTHSRNGQRQWNEPKR